MKNRKEPTQRDRSRVRMSVIIFLGFCVWWSANFSYGIVDWEIEGGFE